MRILHVFPSFGFGGVPIRMADVANRMDGEVNHLAVALDGNIDARAFLAAHTRWDFVDLLPGRGLRRLPEVGRAIRREAPDLLCTYNFGAMDWAMANTWDVKLPHLHFESGFGPDEARRPLRRRNLYRRLALRGAARLVVPSQLLVTLARRYGWAPRRRIHRVPNGVDLRWYDPEARVRPLAHLPTHLDEAPSVVAVAPLRAEKRLDRLIRLFARAAAGTPAQLVLCGQGPCEAALRAQAAESSARERIHFAGHVGDVRRVLRHQAIFAMTSQTEQMPNALLQAMAMRRPVIAFDAGDIARILPPSQRHFVYAQDDDEGFVAGLGRLLGDEIRRDALGAANRARVERDHDMDEMVRAYGELYQATAAGSA